MSRKFFNVFNFQYFWKGLRVTLPVNWWKDGWNSLPSLPYSFLRDIGREIVTTIFMLFIHAKFLHCWSFIRRIFHHFQLLLSFLIFFGAALCEIIKKNLPEDERTISNFSFPRKLADRSETERRQVALCLGFTDILEAPYSHRLYFIASVNISHEVLLSQVQR